MGAIVMPTPTHHSNSNRNPVFALNVYPRPPGGTVAGTPLPKTLWMPKMFLVLFQFKKHIFHTLVGCVACMHEQKRSKIAFYICRFLGDGHGPKAAHHRCRTAVDEHILPFLQHKTSTLWSGRHTPTL